MGGKKIFQGLAATGFSHCRPNKLERAFGLRSSHIFIIAFVNHSMSSTN
jgi:hypothetical protein